MSEYIITGEQLERLEIPDMFTEQEIVRCENCFYFLHREYNSGIEYQTCSYFDSEYAEVEPDGFCKWAERRDA